MPTTTTKERGSSLANARKERRKKLLETFEKVRDQLQQKLDYDYEVLAYDERENCKYHINALTRWHAILEGDVLRHDVPVADFLHHNPNVEYYEIQMAVVTTGDIKMMGQLLRQPLRMIQQLFIQKGVKMSDVLECIHKEYHGTYVVLPDTPHQWYSVIFRDLAAINGQPA